LSRQVLIENPPIKCADTLKRNEAPSASSLPWWEMAAVLAITAGYLFPFTRLLHRIGDEGTIVYGAQRVLEGAVPYRDFVEVMGPGSFYWLAMFFKIFGDTWQISRLCLLITGVGASLLVYWIARQYLNRTAALIAWLFFVILGIPLWPGCNHHLNSNLFALSAVAAFIEWQKRRDIIWLAAAGLLAGITSCFIQQKGAYLLLAFGTLLLMNRARLRLIAVLLWPYLAVGGILMFLFNRAGALGDLVYCTFIWPWSAYHTVNAGIDWNSTAAAIQPGSLYFRMLPLQAAFLFQAFCLIPFLLLLLLPIILIIFTAAVAWRRADVSRLPLLLPALAIWLSEIHRKDMFHLAYGAPLLIIIGIQLLEIIPRHRVRNTLLSITAIAFVLVAIGDLWNTRGGYPVQTRRGMILDVNPDDALVFLNTAVPSREWVFVYPYYPMYYYLADLRNPTRFSILMYHYNTGEQFEEVIRDLEEKRVKFVLWDTVVSGANLRTWFPGYIQPPPDQLKLERYLNASYELASIKNGFRILKRKQ
jgi:4-amino-4-deoxy-L-arabinose transferase-like glycosyltransferase